ncbi:MAG: polysaccharide deacetylase family protein [bacterium]|nr:polysaccharide deacetylase family protein [bacterium]
MAFSPEQNHIAVTYHYVEDPRDNMKGIYPCSMAEFDRQIAFLARRYRFASVPHIFEAAQKGSEEKLCAITFDDGLHDQWENALPILKKYGATATFFAITGTLDGVIPCAHKIHMIASLVSLPELVEKFNIFVSRAFSEVAASYYIPIDRPLNNKRRHDDIASANVKEMLNNIAPRDVSSAFLAEMFKDLGINEQDECKKLFMSREQLRALQDQGFFVETHTHNHYSLDRESADILHEDFHTASDALKHILGNAPRVMAYPYGRPPINRSLLAECDIAYGVTVENRAIARGDDELLIPRFDTNDIKVFLTAASQA